MEQIRLQKYLADAGIASRRKAEELIKQGKVYVNGKIVNELGTKVTPNVDEIRYAVCMCADTDGSKTVYLKKKPES